ncbi:hypothetical protein MRB53_031344 [Persea americana]|uniref:Uncharacterized protein n=1 Tax=Persea americana TaxID=3435 RepID=A0ACC2KNU1_PERAE|nr:hypothetical protein MRB53_031344 [Persea americana]
MKPNLQRLLLNEEAAFNGGSALTSTQDHLPPPPVHPTTTSTIDSSMAVTILVLLAALFFMAFFTIYARRVAEDTATDISRRRIRAAQSRGGTTRPRGVDPTTLRSLPIIAYHGCGGKNPLLCAVCLSEFEEKETVKIIPACGHGYHPKCIDSWLVSRGSCPLCRSTRLFPSEGEVRLEVFDEMPERVREGLGVMRRTRSWCESYGRGALLQRSNSF